MSDSCIATGIAAAVGLAARFAGNFVPSISEFFGNRVEFSVATNSWKRISEGLFLYENGVDPYSGDIYHETPLCLAVLSTMRKVSPRLLDLAFPLCDLITAMLLYFFASNVIEQQIVTEQKSKSKYCKDSLGMMLDFDLVKSVPRTVLLWFVWNPLLIGSCWARTSTTFTGLLLASCLFCASHGGKKVWQCVCLMLLALATYQTLYMFLLFPPLHLYLQHLSKNQASKFNWGLLVGHLAIFGSCLAGLLVLSSHIMGSWSFLRGIYGFLIWAPDLTPNIGLYWYFFTEMFDQFRSFFTAIFFLNMCIYSLPITAKLREDGMFGVMVVMVVTTVFKPYPSYGDIGLYLSLFPLWRHLVSHMRQTLVVSVMVVVASVVFPVLWRLWLQQGSANANFIYALTLVLAAAQVFFVTDLIIAHQKRVWYLYNGKTHLDDKGLKKELHLE